MAHNPPAILHPIPDDIRVFWINEYECWAGRSLEECIEASMKEFGVTREEATDGSEYEVAREEWDSVKCPNDPDEMVYYVAGDKPRAHEIDWERTPYETMRDSVASHDTFPTMIGGRE